MNVIVLIQFQDYNVLELIKMYCILCILCINDAFSPLILLSRITNDLHGAVAPVNATVSYLNFIIQPKDQQHGRLCNNGLYGLKK